MEMEYRVIEVELTQEERVIYDAFRLTTQAAVVKANDAKDFGADGEDIKKSAFDARVLCNLLRAWLNHPLAQLASSQATSKYRTSMSGAMKETMSKKR
jgi:hypothetical protein